MDAPQEWVKKTSPEPKALLKCWYRATSRVREALNEKMQELCARAAEDEGRQQEIQSAFSGVAAHFDSHVMLKLLEAQAFDERVFAKADLTQYIKEMETGLLLKPMLAQAETDGRALDLFFQKIDGIIAEETEQTKGRG